MSVRTRIEESVSVMTSTERKLATTLLSDYPFAGLDSIQSLAGKSRVSAPSVTRFVHKLGCRGYLDFQQSLIRELREEQRSPAELQLSPGKASHQSQSLSQFANTSTQLLKTLSSQIVETRFSDFCDLLSDERRSVYMLGGHMSDPVLQILSRHLRRCRRHIYHISADPESWPDSLLRIGRKDIFLTMDVRRYQHSLWELAEQVANRRKATVVLITDKWGSPISQFAEDVFTVPTENDSAWDSSLAAMTFCEAIIKRVGDRGQSKTRRRLKEWDSFRPTLLEHP